VRADDWLKRTHCKIQTRSLVIPAGYVFLQRTTGPFLRFGEAAKGGRKPISLILYADLA
jgi:hypothetical protein